MNQQPEDPQQEPAEEDVKSAVVAPGIWRSFLAAVQFLTRIPVPSGSEEPPEFAVEALRRGVVFFPLIGGVIGLLTAAVLVLLCCCRVPPLVAAFVALGMEAMLTGAFHEDALADTADALGGGWSREQVLKIMKDSRLGAYGALALILGVGVRVSAMASIAAINYAWAFVAITAAACLGRIAIVVMMATTAPVVTNESSTRDIAAQQTWTTVILATAISLPLWAAWTIWGICFSPLVVLCIAGFLAWFRWRITKRVGGTTGDLLGCTAYITQLIVLIAATI